MLQNYCNFMHSKKIYIYIASEIEQIEQTKNIVAKQL